MIGQSDISYKEIRNVLNAHGGNVGSKHSDFSRKRRKSTSGARESLLSIKRCLNSRTRISHR